MLMGRSNQAAGLAKPSIRKAQVLSPRLMHSIEELRSDGGQRSTMLARAEARFIAERECFVSSVTEQMVKERLAEQLGDQHDLQRKALVEWSNHVERQLTLLRILCTDKSQR
jgi:hypothetical protein